MVAPLLPKVKQNQNLISHLLLCIILPSSFHGIHLGSSARSFSVLLGPLSASGGHLSQVMFSFKLSWFVLLTQGIQFNEAQFKKDVFEKVERPFTFQTNTYPDKPFGELISVSFYLDYVIFIWW